MSHFDSSPMKEAVESQKSQILEIINNANMFKENYSYLMKNIIEPMNVKLNQYCKDAKKSIIIDAVEMALDGIDWNEQQHNLTSLLKSKSPNIAPHPWRKIPKITGKIEGIDEDVFVNMLMNCSVENVKEFQKYRKLARAQMNELPDNITMFENELCTIREQLVNIIRENVQTLFDYHFNYVNDMFHKRSTGRSIVINGKDIELKKSQKDFIVSAMKKIMFS